MICIQDDAEERLQVIREPPEQPDEIPARWDFLFLLPLIFFLCILTCEPLCIDYLTCW